MKTWTTDITKLLNTSQEECKPRMEVDNWNNAVPAGKGSEPKQNQQQKQCMSLDLQKFLLVLLD